MQAHRLRTITFIAVMSFSFVVCELCLAQQNPSELFERARMLEESNQNLAEAIKLYSQVASQAKDQRRLAAKACYQIGVLYDRLGRRADALKAFKLVVTRYADQREVASRAQAKIASAGAIAKNEASLVIKQTGPSADGRVLATFMFPEKMGICPPVIDSSRRRLYVTATRVVDPATDPSYKKRIARPRHRYILEPGTLVVIDLDKNLVVKTVPFTVYLGDIALNRVTRKLYATATVDGSVLAIDTATFTNTRIPVKGYPIGLAVNPVTNRVYVTSQGFAGNDKLFVIDGATADVAGPFDVGGVVGRVVVDSGANRIYAFAQLDATHFYTRVFNGQDNSVLADLAGVCVLEVDRSNNQVYAYCAQTDGLFVIEALDGETLDVLGKLGPALTAGPRYAAADSSANRLYVTLPSTDQIAVLDTHSNKEVGRSSVEAAHFIAIDPATDRLYVCAGSYGSQIRVLDRRALEEELPDEFYESFEGPTLDPAWTITPGQGSYSLVESPGRLRLQVVEPRGRTLYMMLARKFYGDEWTLETKVAYFTGATGGPRRLLFTISFGAPPQPGGRPGDNGLAVFRNRGNWKDCCPGETGVQFLELGTMPPPSRQPPNAADSYVWRIKRAGRTIAVERSDDRSSFVVIGTRTFGPQIDGVIQYLGISYTTFQNNDAYADYDYVRLTRNHD